MSVMFVTNVDPDVIKANRLYIYFSCFEISALNNCILSIPYSNLGCIYKFHKDTETSGFTPLR